MTEQNGKSEDGAWNLLYEAHELFVKELFIVHSCLEVMKIIGLNTNKLKGQGTEFVRFAKLLSQRTLVTGIESLYERKDGGQGLCSIRGVFSLAKVVGLKSHRSAYEFCNKYGVETTDNWCEDVENVLKKQRPIVAACTKYTSKVRNERVAHLPQPKGSGDKHFLPNIDSCEKSIEFAYDFYVFIAKGFLNAGVPAELHDSISGSLCSLLKDRFGVQDLERNI